MNRDVDKRAGALLARAWQDWNMEVYVLTGAGILAWITWELYWSIATAGRSGLIAWSLLVWAFGWFFGAGGLRRFVRTLQGVLGDEA